MAEGRRDGGWERELNDPPLKLPSNRHRNAAAYYLCVAADTEPSLRSRAVQGAAAAGHVTSSSVTTVISGDRSAPDAEIRPRRVETPSPWKPRPVGSRAVHAPDRYFLLSPFLT